MNLRIEYHDNGNIKVQAEIENGKEHGQYYKFYEDEILAEAGIKIKGKMNGVWKFYNSFGSLKSVAHFYNDSLAYNLDINDFSFSSIKIENDLNVMIPKNWEIINELEDPVLLAIKKKCGKEISFCPNFTITYDSSIANDKIKDYLMKSNDLLKSGFVNFRVIKEKVYSYEDITCFEKIYTGQSQGVRIGGITTWIFSNKKTYIATGLALNEKENSFLKNEGLFKDIIGKIKPIN